MDVFLVSGVVGGVSVVCGLPLAGILRLRHEGVLAFLVDAFLFGIVYLTLSATVFTWLGWQGLVAAAVLWAGALGAVARDRWRSGLSDARPKTALVRRSASPGLVIGWAAVLVVGAALRLQWSNFILWIGDMGAYVNWADEFARTGTLDASWPPLFPAYLGLSAAAFGAELTTAAMPALGLLFVLAVARLLHELRTPPWIVLAGAAATAVNVHAVWYSTFPASESFAAGLLLVWFLLVLRFLRTGRAVVALAAGGASIAMCLLRGNAMGYVLPVTGVMVLVALVPVWRGYASRWSMVWAGSMAGVAVGHLYGISRIREYYVTLQLPSFVPGPVMRAIEHLGLFDPTARTVALVLAAVLASSAVVIVSARWIGRRTPSARGRSVSVGVVFAGLAIVSLAVVVLAVRSRPEAWLIMERTGWYYAAGLVASVVLVAFLRRTADQLTVLLMASLAVMFFAIQIWRLGPPRVHLFFLYWDRYLVSEFIPVAIVLSFLAFGLVASWGTAFLRLRAGTGWWSVPLMPALAVLSVVTITLPAVPALRTATQRAFLSGSYPLTAELADVTGRSGNPVFWSADGDAGIDDFHYPNTWSAFSLPLAWVFGITVVNTDHSFGATADDVASAAQLRTAAACADVSALTVVEAERQGDPLDERMSGSGLVVTSLGGVEGGVEMLSQGIYGPGWYVVDFRFELWTVAVPDDQRVACPAGSASP